MGVDITTRTVVLDTLNHQHGEEDSMRVSNVIYELSILTANFANPRLK